MMLISSLQPRSPGSSSSWVVLLLLWATVGEAHFASQRTTAAVATRTLPEKYHRIDRYAPILVTRGGAIELDDNDNDDGLQKLRNVVRSMMEILDRKAPPVAGLLKGVFGMVETVLGVRLLPRPKTAASKKKKSKANKSTAVETTSRQVQSSAAAAKKKKKPSTAAQAHLQKELKMSSPNYRIQRELKEFLRDPPPNLTVKVGKNIRVWIVTMKGAKNTIYEGETFQLRISFPPKYPTVPPSVYFLPPHIPTHEHVYTNGDICLSLLGNGWRPTMTAQSIAVSILSSLSSAQTKSLPMDNARHAQNKPGEYQKDWVYHDDSC